MKLDAILATLPAAILCALSAGGCVFSIGGGTTSEIVYTNSPPPHPGRPPCSVAPEEYSVTIDEINAASTLEFDPSRKEMLSAIAGRPGLGDAAQEYLVCMSLDKLDFEPSKKDVLSTLVNNPDFSPRGKAAILRNLHRLDFEPTRTDLMRQMQGKGDEPPRRPAVYPTDDGARDPIERQAARTAPATAPSR